MAEKQYLDADGLAVVASKVNEKLKVVATMPVTPTNGQVVLYVGTTTATYTQGGIYLYNGTAWVLISTADVDLTPYKKIFTGTRAEWDLLSTAEKKAYDEADLTDDLAGGELVVSDSVTAGDLNPVTSNAVANLIVVEQDTSESITIEAGAYTEWQTTISSTKNGYRIASLTASPLVNDAIIATVHELSGVFRVTVYNSAGIQQTQAVRLIVVWVKE